MDARFEVRKAELLAGCKLSPEELEGVRERLREFVAPFAEYAYPLDSERYHM